MQPFEHPRVSSLVPVVAACALTTGCAAKPPADAPAWRQVAPDPQRIAANLRWNEVCGYETPSRTRFPEWVCRTREQAARQEQQAVDLLRNWQRGHGG
ncbi:MAG: hypothetical protein O9284_14720 [Steroidobacteraceae bacterium]|jgi:hypothetical protein|nr:hypothetical protein [Steroidobacteraceae bacterium]